MRKEECIADPELDRTFFERWRANAEILTEDGKRCSTMVEYPGADPGNPLFWEAIIERFHDFSGQIMKKEQRLKIDKAVKRLDEIKDICKWSSLLLRKE